MGTLTKSTGLGDVLPIGSLGSVVPMLLSLESRIAYKSAIVAIVSHPPF